MWLKHSSEPWPEVLKLWSETARYRQQAIKKSDKGVMQILDEWPRYKDSLGYTLVIVYIVHI